MAKNKSDEIARALPQSAEEMNALIIEKNDKLSARLKVIAAWLLENPQQVALNTLAETAKSAGVHASTLVRFANYFGFVGFSELQRLYKTQLIDHQSNYLERIRQLKDGNTEPSETQASVLLDEFTEGNVLALQLLQQTIDPALLSATVDTLNQANEIFLCGLRRMYPVATYLHYTLCHMDVRCHLVDGTAAMEQEQMRWATPESVLIAITVSTYANVTAEVVRAASQLGCKVVLITDSELCPIAHLADHLLVVREAEVRSFRALNSTLCLAQTLCVALGYQRQEEKL
jgi:DNA-binding MurR/RpiR family transcriptional regulator